MVSGDARLADLLHVPGQKSVFRPEFSHVHGHDLLPLVYLVWPNGLDLRVEITQTNWAARLVAALQGFDTPTNVCPSIHVSSTVAVELAVRRSESLGKKGWLKAANFVVTVAICLSTMFLKQHSAVDVVLGIALSLLLGWVTWHTNWQAALKKTPLRVLFQQRL